MSDYSEYNEDEWLTAQKHYDDWATGELAAMRHYEEEEEKQRCLNWQATIYALDSLMLELNRVFSQPILACEYQSKDNVFCKQGHVWVVKYQGNFTLLNDERGMSHIHRLLQKPNDTISAIELYRSTEGPGQETLSIDSFTLQDVVDEATLRSCNERLSEITSELEEAESNNDLGTVQRLSEQREAIQKYIRQSQMLSGQSTTFSDTADKARKAVSNAIKRALGSIEKEIPALYLHLKNSINAGTQLVYQPETKIPWEL